MVNQSEAAGHIAHAAQEIESAQKLNTQLEIDLSSHLSAIDKLDELIAAIVVNLEATNLPRATALVETAKGAANHVEAADEDQHFEETSNALAALTMVEESNDGAAGLLGEMIKIGSTAVGALKELEGAIKAIHDQCSEVTISLLTGASNVEQLGQRLNAG